MAIKIKAGTAFQLPVIIEDDDFAMIDAIEFVFTQKQKGGDTLKSAYWSRDGESRDASLREDANTILVNFSREDSYLFKQGAVYFMDTRIHYEDTEDNPFTRIIPLTMNMTLFKQGEEVTANG